MSSAWELPLEDHCERILQISSAICFDWSDLRHCWRNIPSSRPDGANQGDQTVPDEQIRMLFGRSDCDNDGCVHQWVWVHGGDWGAFGLKF